MTHNLFLSMYTFQVKKLNESNSKIYENNNYLNDAYKDEKQKFTEGFAQDIINLIDSKAFKNEKNTHGAVLEEQAINHKNRTIDLLVNGGITGINQFLIDESGGKTNLSSKEIVGLKFYARIWLPANTTTGYIFIQKYGYLSIKPVFDSIIKQVLNNKGFTLLKGKVVPSTTKVRQEKFLKVSSLRDITIVSKSSVHDTGEANSSSAFIKLKNVSFPNGGIFKPAFLPKILKSHGFSIGDRSYTINATYENKYGDYKEEKTVVLDDTDETLNVIPNIVVPQNCVDADNYPIFTMMQALVDREMIQVRKEAKI